MSARSAMPVADAICMPGRIVRYPDLDSIKDPEWSPAEKFANDMLATCKRVYFAAAPEQEDIWPIDKSEKNVALALYGDDATSALRDAVGPQRLPFDRMWLEGIWPSMNKWVTSQIQAIAVRASSDDKSLAAKIGDNGRAVPTGGAVPNGVAFTIFALMGDGSVTRHPIVTTALLDDHGSVAQLWTAARNPNTLVFSEPVNNADMAWWTVGMVLPAMWAIGLMNCRNVKTCEVSRTPTKTGKQRRERGRGLLSYHTIVLPNASTGSGSGASVTAGSNRLHMVRGHFATYTTDAPLFGKHVGTFWKPWHLSGNPERGEIASEYKIKEGHK